MRFSSFSYGVVTIGCACLLNGSVMAGPLRPVMEERLPKCDPAKIQRVFPQDEGVYLLLLPLSGVEAGDAALGARVTKELKDRLPAWAGKELDGPADKDMPRNPVKSTIEMLSCTVSAHTDAERVGRAAGATAVVWGRASCQLPDSAACRGLPLNWDLSKTSTARTGQSTAQETNLLRLSLTVVRDTPANAFAAGAPRAWRFEDIDLPSHDTAHAHGLLDEVAGFWVLRQVQLESGLRLFERARRSVTGGPSEESLLDVVLGEVYAVLGKTSEAKRAMENALANCGTDNETCRFTSLYRLGMLEAQLGNSEKSVVRLSEALGMTEHLNDRRNQRVVLHSLATIQAEHGQLQSAIKLFERGLAASQAAHDQEQEADALRSLAYVYAHLGDIAKAEAYSDQAFAVYERLKAPLGQVSVLNQLGLLYAAKAMTERADEVFGRALILSRQNKLLDGEGAVLNNQAMVYKARGDLGRAVQVLQRALQLATQMHNLAAQGTAQSSLGTLYLEQDDLKQAEQHFTAALALRKQVHDRLGEAYTRRGLGHVRQRQGKRDEAFAEFEKALRLHALGGNPQEYGGLVLDMGKLLMDQGKHEQAIAWFRQALPELDKAQLHEAEAGVLMRLTEAYEARGAVTEAIRTLERALPKFEAPAARPARRDLLAGLGLLLAEERRISEAVLRYREAAALASDPSERETRYFLLGYALDLSLEHGDRATAEQVIAELRASDAPMEMLLGAEAQLLGRTRSPDAEAKYQYLSFVGQNAGNSSGGQFFKLLGMAGLARIHHASAWKGCPGLLVMNVDQPTLPVSVGDVALRVDGQCLSGTASLQRAGRQAAKAAALKVELWRNDELLKVTLPGGKVPFVGSPF